MLNVVYKEIITRPILGASRLRKQHQRGWGRMQIHVYTHLNVDFAPLVWEKHGNFKKKLQNNKEISDFAFCRLQVEISLYLIDIALFRSFSTTRNG